MGHLDATLVVVVQVTETESKQENWQGKKTNGKVQGFLQGFVHGSIHQDASKRPENNLSMKRCGSTDVRDSSPHLVRFDEFFNLREFALPVPLQLARVGLLVVEVVVLDPRRLPVTHEPVHLHRVAQHQRQVHPEVPVGRSGTTGVLLLLVG